MKAVHAADDKSVEVVVLELDKALKGTHAVITHTPLRDGYKVNAFAATDGKGWFTPDKGEASTVDGAMMEETETTAVITPDKDQEICDGDMGAPVCSSVGGHIFEYELPGGTCGLSGLVLSRVDPAAKTTGTTKGCSSGPYTVVKLGQYHDDLAKYAPEAFEPLVIDKFILRSFPFAPDGLWGYKTKGDITACTLGSTALSALKPGASTAKLNAKVSFANMATKAAPYGRFGIAPKSDPTNMRWLPAQRMDAADGTKFDATFKGTVNAAKDGDYIVAFRASANGGETWTECDTDGIANGFSPAKVLALTISDATAPTTPPGTTPQSSTPPSDPPATSGEEATNDDGSAYPTTTASDPTKDEPTTKTKTSSGGCAQSGSSSPLGSAFPMVATALGLLAMRRRRGGS